MVGRDDLRGMQDAWRAYLDLALGMTETSRKRATKVARDLLGRGNATAEQVQAMGEELIRTGLSNREGLTRLVRFELDRALGRVGLATAEEVHDLTARVRELEARLAGAAGTGAGRALDPAGAVPAPAAMAKKTVAKKTVANKAVAAALAPEPVAPAVVAKKTAANKTAANKTAAKKSVAKKAAANKPLPAAPRERPDPARLGHGANQRTGHRGGYRARSRAGRPASDG